MCGEFLCNPCSIIFGNRFCLLECFVFNPSMCCSNLSDRLLATSIFVFIASILLRNFSLSLQCFLLSVGLTILWVLLVWCDDILSISVGFTLRFCLELWPPWPFSFPCAHCAHCRCWFHSCLICSSSLLGYEGFMIDRYASHAAGSFLIHSVSCLFHSTWQWHLK